MSFWYNNQILIFLYIVFPIIYFNAIFGTSVSEQKHEKTFNALNEDIKDNDNSYLTNSLWNIRIIFSVFLMLAFDSRPLAQSISSLFCSVLVF